MKMKVAIKVFLFLVICAFLSALCQAQAGRGTGRLQGTVYDEAGTPIAGAKVQLEFEKGGLKADTACNAKGEWAVLGLGTGKCRVTVGADGYRPVTIEVEVKQLERNEPLRITLKSDGSRKAESISRPAGQEENVTKTYMLKYISPQEVQRVLRTYFWQFSFGESNMIVVLLPKKNVADFEEQLKKLDVERRTIDFRIFMVHASKESRPETIDNKDLKRVLGELGSLLSFRSYSLEGASLISVKDGSQGEVQLSVNPARRCEFDNVRIIVNAEGKRAVQFRLRMSQYFSESKQNMNMIESNTDVLEDGYLVAGVSKIENGDSLVLVINAQIK